MSGERNAPATEGSRFGRAGSWIARVDPLVADALLALVLAVPLLVDLNRADAPAPPFREADLGGFVLVALLVVPLALRRRYPVAVFSVILVASTLTMAFAYRPASYGFGLIVATYTVARWRDRRSSLVALVLALGFSVVVKARFLAAGVDIELFSWPLDAAYIAGGWFLGDSIRERARQAAELQQKREALAEQAVEREHLRIARELHDSVGHSLSAMVLYADQADRVVDARPDGAHELLGTVTATGRAALADMDRFVRMLRGEERHPPGVSNVDDLADEFRGLGLPVEVTITGQPRTLPEAVDASAYRITQEALTNTLKHAHARSAEVHLHYTTGSVTVTVVDDGAGCAEIDARTSRRHGLTGMRERATALGGDLHVGPGPGGAGFTVEARLPVPGVASP